MRNDEKSRLVVAIATKRQVSRSPMLIKHLSIPIWSTVRIFLPPPHSRTSIENPSEILRPAVFKISRGVFSALNFHVFIKSRNMLCEKSNANNLSFLSSSHFSSPISLSLSLSLHAVIYWTEEAGKDKPPPTLQSTSKYLRRRSPRQFRPSVTFCISVVNFFCLDLWGLVLYHFMNFPSVFIVLLWAAPFYYLKGARFECASPWSHPAHTIHILVSFYRLEKGIYVNYLDLAENDLFHPLFSSWGFSVIFISQVVSHKSNNFVMKDKGGGRREDKLWIIPVLSTLDDSFRGPHFLLFGLLLLILLSLSISKRFAELYTKSRHCVRWAPSGEATTQFHRGWKKKVNVKMS